MAEAAHAAHDRRQCPATAHRDTDGQRMRRRRTLYGGARIENTVSNLCVPGDAQEPPAPRMAENSEQIRKLSWALRLERDAHQKKMDNPLGHPLLPTHAEIQERLAEQRAREAKFEHKSATRGRP